MIFLELNEFNRDLLQDAASKLQLKNLQKLVAMHQSETETDDTYESDFLEPWVQWVSIHTGTPSSIHQIKHLGDVPHLATPQLWETLSENKISSGIWVAINASRRGARECRFFLPDPWTASEKAYPEDLNLILEPLRYISKNYLNLSFRMSQKLIGMIRLFLSHGLGFQVLKKIPRLMKELVRFRGAHFVFISFFESLSTLLFLKYREKYNPDFSLLFLNTLAHLQHRHWKEGDLRQNPRLVLGLQYVDQSLGEIFKSLKPGEILVVTNALSQKNTNEEKPWILYRQIDQKAFLETIGLQNVQVESHMTHDAHLFFKTQEECEKGERLLKSAEILGQKLFLVEAYPKEPTKLFYRIAFTDEISPNTSFTIGGKTFRFFDLFQPIVRRTGKHIPIGTIYSNQPIFPKKIKNHEIYHYILKRLSPN